jgi:signal transduction histidine kinase
MKADNRMELHYLEAPACAGQLHIFKRKADDTEGESSMISPKPLSPGKGLSLEQVDKLLSAYKDRYRYSSLGFLVKGIIHNFNGHLQIFSTQMELLQGLMAKEKENCGPAIHAKMEKCLEQVEKMKVTIEHLIQKATDDAYGASKVISINELLEEELSLLHHDLFFKHQVEVKKVLSSQLPVMRGSYLDFSEGLLNFVRNAIEAMEGAPRKELTVMTETGERQIRVMVKDTGCGISEKNKPYLFNPFFTTKGGKHYGLGLFMARELLTPYGASFHYTSQDGETVFWISFPLPDARPEASREKA